MKFHLICFSLTIYRVASLVIPSLGSSSSSRTLSTGSFSLAAGDDEWLGDVVSNQGGKIAGCSIQQVGESITDWIITIDG